MRILKNTSLKRNMLMNILLTTSMFIFPIITFPYVSRIIFAEGTGKVAFAASVVANFAIFAQLGIPIYGIKACALVRDDKQELIRVAHELLIINIIITAITYLAFIISLFTVDRFRDEKFLLIITSSTMLFNALGAEWLYKGLEQYTYITIRSIVFKCIGVIAMFLLVRQQEDYIIYGAISIFATLGSNVLNFINLRRIISLRPIGGYRFRRHFKAIFIFFSLSAINLIYSNLNATFIGFLRTDTDVGYYDAANKGKGILVACIISLGAVLLPRATYYIEHKRFDEFKRITGKALNFVFVASIPATLFFTLFAEESIYLLSGLGFHGSILPIQIMMPSVVIVGVSQIIGIQTLVPLGKERFVLYSMMTGAIINVALVLILVPRYGAAGAAVGALAAETAVLCVQLVLTRDMIKELFGNIRYWIICLGTIIGMTSVLWIKEMMWSNFITLAISASIFICVYATVLLILKEPLLSDYFFRAIKKAKERISR